MFLRCSIYAFTTWYIFPCFVETFWKEVNSFFQQGCIQLIESDTNNVFNLIKDLFQINAVIFKSQTIQKILKKYNGFQIQNKILNRTIVINIDDKKYVLSSKSAY